MAIVVEYTQNSLSNKYNSLICSPVGKCCPLHFTHPHWGSSELPQCGAWGDSVVSCSGTHLVPVAGIEPGMFCFPGQSSNQAIELPDIYIIRCSCKSVCLDRRLKSSIFMTGFRFMERIIISPEQLVQYILYNL